MQWRIVFCDQPHDLAGEINKLSRSFELVRLAPELPRAEAMALLQKAHVFHNPAEGWRVTSELLQACPNLLYCSPDGAGYDAIDVPACTGRGICVANQSGLNAPTVAEFAVSVMLAHAHKLVAADRAMRLDRTWTRLAFTGRDLRGSTVGIIGFGNIGSRVGEICRNGFSMGVLAYDPWIASERLVAAGAQPVTLDELLQRADVVTIHLPLTDQTRGMIGATEIAKMKLGALLITTSRGGVVDEDALATALTEGQLGGAAVDVWSQEPPSLDHPLLKLEQVIATPHIAGSTVQGYEAVAVSAAEQIVMAFEGRRPPRMLNPVVWPVFLDRLTRARQRAG
jgi:D-3-phosphoglycerate dehydrogenase / 2-oxoglutarate reductase